MYDVTVVLLLSALDCLQCASLIFAYIIFANQQAGG